MKLELPEDKSLHTDLTQGLNNLLIQFRKEGSKSNAHLWFRHNTKLKTINSYGNNVSTKDVLYYEILIDNLNEHSILILKDLGYDVEFVEMTRFERKLHYEKLKLNKFKWKKLNLTHMI